MDPRTAQGVRGDLLSRAGPAKRTARKMVRIHGLSEYDRLDALVRRVVGEFDFELDVTGWTRKTYDVYHGKQHGKGGLLIARVESFATTNGEVVVYDDLALPLAERLGLALEQEFGISEAVIVRR